MAKFKSYWSAIKPYSAIVGLYAMLLTALKLVEYFAVGLDAPNKFQLLGNAVLYNLIVTSWVFLGLGVVYWLLQLISKRVALILAAVCYGVLLLSETGLLLYTIHNGYLLGNELVARPFSETLMAIHGAVGVVLPVVLTIVLTGGFIVLALWRAKKPSGAAHAVLPIAIVLVLLSLIFMVSNLVPNRYSYFIINKTQYLAGDCYDYLQSEHNNGAQSSASIPIYDKTLIEELLLSHPEWGTPNDSIYPLERSENAGDFLSAHFDTCTTPPNIVILIVESMGAEVISSGAMPFIDSLASSGLYWPNCMSSSIRSYGAIPAITGSVGGPKGFQFGTMPAHNSLLSLLKHEGYNTRAYYAGDFTFDCVYEYLTAQDIDYLSPFFDEFTNSGINKEYWWGYHDDELLRRTFEDLSTLDDNDPYCALVTTLTMHDVLRLSDVRQQKYEQMAQQIAPSPSGYNLDALYSACLFTDDYLRLFFEKYSKRSDFNRTIFVITGDHASGRQRGDKLSFHHVPLIIWSPLITRPATFKHPVTHNDIAPSIYRLLTNKYGLKAQPTVHWLGEGLGPSPKTLLIVNLSHEIHDIVFHNHYYQSQSRFKPETLYSFGDDLLLNPCNDPVYLDSCRKQLTLMRYLYDYTYRADRLTAHPLHTKQYKAIRTYKPATDIECRTPNEPPSSVGNNSCTVLPSTILKDTEGYSMMRLTFEADVIVHDSIDQAGYPAICFRFEGDLSLNESAKLSKFITGDVVGLTGTYHISLAKEFPLSTTRQNYIFVQLSTPTLDDEYQPGSQITLHNTSITIDYAK